MSILDDLFTAAAQLRPSQGAIWTYVAVTITPAATYPKAGSPQPIVAGWGQLNYTPPEPVNVVRWHGFLAPHFDGNLELTSYAQGFGKPASSPEPIKLAIESSGTLEVKLPNSQSVQVKPEIDSTTNVVSGAVGANYIAISLSGVTQAQVPQ
ncbi:MULTISPECIES: hypothetical protein [unclassified Mycolicibacterium]|uniref:hypothetical protein n=1 Tax=unclassified Mycolicibacterium TaxID=2636767 RepID=UPI0012DF3EC0|nr:MULTISPECIES: hypothetical protein [unclassified Mycolicibacterium]MUL84808.1 hypothetical protein [Mycolicibacterium sp. CBMA 329]MUL88584.1 hypothetical protein [Mycolicibacterium sp. CBMA 331]MUM00076.1 hypothetical protein [Mycolicibacterium sp. CBMA 334]MUM29187.1 hypothetical protein [Mycolicibacterium sp. CBMA 295]MUM40231.1 hypothetical protein [Mycolicibacterium sp. CBMA 247]